MSQYISGRQPFLNVGIPGITTNTPVMNVTGRVGVGITDPTADLDLFTLRIRQSLFDANNSSGELGYFLTKDAVGLKWTGVPPLNNNAIFAFQNGVLSGVSSYTGINFLSDGNDLVAISTNNFNTKIVDVKINSYWIKSGNTGIYTSKFVGIGSTTPTVALDVIGDGKFSGIVTAGKFSGQSGIITGNVEVGSVIVTGISTFVGVTTFSKVGIGSTTIPRATLDVGGDVWVSGAVTAISFTADNFYGTISTSKYADSAGFTTSISIGSTTSTDDTSYLVLVGSSGTTIQQPFIDSQSLSYDGQTNTLNSDNIKVGFITATNAWIGVATINDLRVVNDVFKVGTAITMSNGIITATIFKGKFLDFENLRVSGVSTFVGIATFGTVGIGTTNIIGSDKLTIIGDARLGGHNDVFRVGNAITMSNGIITATTFSGKFLDFENLIVSGVSTFTNGPVFIGSGTSTGTAGQVLQISGINSSVYIGGNVGLGTTNPTSKLFVVGDGYFTGVITASEFKGNASTSGYASTAGIATYATDAGISTNLKGGSGGSLPYQSSANTTAFLANGSVGKILQSNGGTNAPSWESPQGLTIGYANTAGISTFATKAGIATYTSEWILDANGSSDYTFTGPGFTGAENDPVLYLVRGQQYKFTNTMGMHPFRIQNIPGLIGITTYNDGITNNNVIDGTLTWNVQFDAPGLLYYQCTAHGAMGGKIYIIDAGIGPDISINTTGIITASSFVGAALSISGISTFGGSNGVVIKLDGSNGIVTSANPGFSTVTYYGDGSKLTGIGTAASATNVALTTDTSSTTTNIVFSQTPNQNPTSSLKTNPGLIFNASTSSLGIGTTNPTEKLDVNGNIRLRSGLRDSTDQLGGPDSILSSDGSNVIWSSIGSLGGSEISLGEDNATTTPQYLIFTNATSGIAFTERVSPSKLSFIASSGSLGIGTSSPLTPLQVEKYGVKTGFGTFVASSGITTDVDSFVISNTNFKTAEYTVHIQSSSSIQAQKVLVMQNGTSAFSQEYGIMYEPTFMISIGATVSGGLCKLQFTPETGVSGLMTYRFARETMI